MGRGLGWSERGDDDGMGWMDGWMGRKFSPGESNMKFKKKGS